MNQIRRRQKVPLGQHRHLRFPRFGGFPAEEGTGSASGTEDEGDETTSKEHRHHRRRDDEEEDYWTASTTTTERWMLPKLVPPQSGEPAPPQTRSKIAALLSKQSRRLAAIGGEDDDDEGEKEEEGEGEAYLSFSGLNLQPPPGSLPYISNLISPMTQLNYDENQNKKCSRDRGKDPNIPFPPFVKIDLGPVINSAAGEDAAAAGAEDRIGLDGGGVVALVNDEGRGGLTTSTTLAEDERNPENKSQTKWHKKGEVVEADRDGIDFSHLSPYHEAVRAFLVVSCR